MRCLIVIPEGIDKTFLGWVVNTSQTHVPAAVFLVTQADAVVAVDVFE